MSTTKAPDYKASMNQLETMLDEYLGKKAPAMPDNVKETLVSFSPYLAIIGIVMAIPAVTALFGVGALLGPLSTIAGYPYMMNLGMGYYIGIAGLVLSAVLDGMAIPGLFKRAMGAWKLMFYSSLVTFIAAILQGNLSSAIIGGIISMYILFQVKGMYK